MTLQAMTEVIHKTQPRKELNLQYGFYDINGNQLKNKTANHGAIGVGGVGDFVLKMS